jgi:hypothetical protein
MPACLWLLLARATVTGAQPVAVTVMQVTPQSLLAYTGFASTSTNPIMPLVSSGYYNSGTGIQIQNTGASNTNVTISYTPSAGFPGSPCTETRAVAAGTSVTFAYPTFPAGCGPSFLGSGKVTANSAGRCGNRQSGHTGSSDASSYDAINSANATNKVSLPLIMDRNYTLYRFPIGMWALCRPTWRAPLAERPTTFRPQQCAGSPLTRCSQRHLGWVRWFCNLHGDRR